MMMVLTALTSIATTRTVWTSTATTWARATTTASAGNLFVLYRM